MKVVILAENHKDKGLRIRQFYPYENKVNYLVDIGDTLTIKELSPYPFEHFSSLNKFDKGWKPTYLLVEADLSNEEWRSMQSAGIAYHRFTDREITVLSEFKKPFEYGYERLLEFGSKKLQLFDFYSNIINQKTRSKKEFKAMSKILELAYMELLDTEYWFEVTINKYTAPYVKQLLAYDDKIRLDYRGYKKDINLLVDIANDLIMSEFITLVKTAFIYNDYLLKVLVKSNFDRDEIEKELFNGELKGLLFFGVKSLSKKTIERIKKITTLDKYITGLIEYEMSSDFQYSVLNMIDNTLTWKEWLSLSVTEVPLYEEFDNNSYLYTNDDDYYQDNLYYDSGNDDYFDDYDEPPARETEPKLVDVRLSWINHIVTLLQDVLTIQQIREYIPFVNETLWKQYLIEKPY